MPMMRKLGVLVAILTMMVVCLAVSAYAYTQEEIDSFTGPAFGISSTGMQANGIPGITPAKYGDLINAKDNQDGTYTFEGKTFTVDYSWGQHCLTGYTDTGNCTASGVMPTPYHTVSGPKSMLGKYCLIKGAKMLNGQNGLPQSYDGIYKFEDTGGAAVEYGIERTMNVPVVDIYCSTLAEALAVTEKGSIIADVYILNEVK